MFPLGWADACTPRQGVTLLYGPSICTRSVRMDLLRSQVLQPFPTPGSGTLWVARESLRDRRVSCLPRWTVCPTRSPSLDPNGSTCRGVCSWSGPLVTSEGRCHPRPLTDGPGRIPPYCVCSDGANTVTRGGVRSLACVSRGHPRPAPPSRCVGCVGGFSASPGWGVEVVGGGRLLATPGRVACMRVPALPGWVPPPVVAGGPSSLLAECLRCGSPPLLAGVLWCCWGVGLRHSWLRSAGLWGVVVADGPLLLAEGPGWAFPRHS